MLMPKPDSAIIARRDEIIACMHGIVTRDNVIVEEDELRAYDCDGLMAYKQMPLIVVLPETTEQVSRILKYCHNNDVKIVPRGAGTGLSGGALPLADAITLGLGKFKKIIETDYDNRCVVTQPGVTNLALTQAVEHRGFYYADCVLHRWQCSGELRRCALPEIRTDDEQCSGCGNGAYERRCYPYRRQTFRRARV